MPEKRPRILAVASSGGHWVQLRRLRPAFEGCDVAYLTTDAGHKERVAPDRLYTTRDANRWNKVALVVSALKVLWVVLKERPDVVITTGAAPGYFALRFGKLLGARTMWIDSIANVEELSMSGRMASERADLCLTQWPHLAGGKVRYEGGVL
jgi:UDP-N-acetylglucosamine:LPS N-acetylglucosamine transferase